MSNKATGEPLKGGAEQDALTGWRRFLSWRAGERKAAKTSFWRRVRRKPIEMGEDDE
ncbi:hypothetical protein [Ancylobacter polymorphus]|uniref:Uncharacterized protein n=1 Tax=Ancylobacter polymorphus TaxID=223390 RepID=A0A9E7D789_9HYPH|nr:hypothetical protein [Ancylobacter polymorphus]UOK71736.1 hypothetical protein K9D25_03135 [Ancylobacter polymorphus]